jgi:hypothetical protein
MDTIPFVPTDQQVEAFKDWVQSQDRKPRVWDAQRWFQSSQEVEGVSEASLNAALEPLIDEAIEDATRAVEERSKVLPIFPY